MSEFYQVEAKKIIDELDTNIETGLSVEEAARRLEEFGHNEIIETGKKSIWRILWEQMTSIMVVILIIAALISVGLEEYLDGIVIAAIILINAAIGFQQEYKAEEAMSALKKMAVPLVKVRRDGHISEISSRDLVPGDIVLLEAGNLVPADARLVESVNLRIEEAALTGESVPVEKNAKFVAEKDMPLGDRLNMTYMGTVVSYGRATAVVVETGMDTELGHIATLIQTTGQELTPLQKRINQLSKGLAVAAVALVLLVFIIGMLRGEPFQLILLTGISMAVAAVPEGLPAVVTIALALGAQRMLKRRSLIRKLPAVETLGSVTVICSDKTGTLTENRMTVTILDVAGHTVDFVEDLRDKPAPHLVLEDEEPDQKTIEMLCRFPALTLLLAGGALANDAVLERQNGEFEYVGDPTEGALVVAAARAGLEKTNLEETFPRQVEVPFDSTRKRMTTAHEFPRISSDISPHFKDIWNWSGYIGEFSYVIFSKGAVDSLVPICDRVWVGDQVEPLTERWLERIMTANNEQAEAGMRVLGVATRTLDQLDDEDAEEALESGLIFVGMVSMMDPARPEVKDAVQLCTAAGIRPVMITGDHPLTAGKIADELGISNNSRILTGQDLEKLTPEEFKEIVCEVDVFARVSPEHKLKIVQALEEQGEIVAMTGDGVNDAPALNAADIGVAMGITGTDVAKEASDMILLDDNFATIVAAVEEGRRIYDNIRKFFTYTMTSNAGEIWVMLIAPLIGMPFALLPLQILWVNLVTDGLPGLALGIEPAEKNVMHRPPYPPDENVFGRGMARQILWVGIWMGLISLGIGYYYWSIGNPNWQTIVFTTLTLSQMGNALALRSQRESLFSIGLLSNKSMLNAVLLTFVLQIAVIYVPFLQSIFKTNPLSWQELLISLFLSTLVFWGVEFEKWIKRRADRR
ncbi:MAG: cation-translocating P-type ATPase [Chloroflexota bacterium]|nr:MAG: cation-translocating P-type ATPase [Chloroflexota bacterium]